MQSNDKSRGFIHIDSFDHLRQWSETQVDPLQKSNTPLLRRTEQYDVQAGKSKLMLIHDYEGSYLNYEACQGTVVQKEKYSCEYLQHVEVFVYFSHKLVTVPPPTWTNTCHRNGVKVLGTFIVEPDTLQIERILEQQDGEYWVAKQLASIAQAYGFDGWLVNIEKPFPVLYWSSSGMEAFLRQLRSCLGDSRRLIWYDALTSLNVVWYQNTLNYLNLTFAVAAGAILTNYAWNPAMAKQAKEIAERSGLGVANVYLGIDAWAQNTLNGKNPRVTYPPKTGGGTGIGMGIKELASVGVNVGVFAPGWSFEHFKQHNREVERAVWLGDKLVTDLPCDCTPTGLHLTVPYQEHPIVKYVISYPAGSSSFLHTDFRRAFYGCERSEGALGLCAHLGRQSVLPIPTQADFQSAISVSSDTSLAYLCAELYSDPPRYSFSIRLPPSSSDLQGTRIQARLRILDLSVTDRRPIKLRLACRKANTTGVMLKLAMNDFDEIEIPTASQNSAIMTKILPNTAHRPLQRIDLILDGTLGRIRKLEADFLSLTSLTIRPDPTSKVGVEIRNLRIEQRGNPHVIRYRLVWELSDDLILKSEGMPYSDVTGPFSHFCIRVNGNDVGVAFALEYEMMSDVFVGEEADREVVITIVGVGFDGLPAASTRKSLCWSSVHDDDWILV